MSNLSKEALVLIGGFWGGFASLELSFLRPQIMTEEARMGLTELVEKGFLIETPRNKLESSPIDFRPTEKMRNAPHVSREWLLENTFKITNEELVCDD